MAKHPLSSIIIGIIFLIGGFILTILPVFSIIKEAKWVSWIYGIPMLIIGIVLLFWKREDEIEQRKDLVKMKGGSKK